MDIEARKIAIIKQILNIENERLIRELEIKLIQFFSTYQSPIKDKKNLSNKQHNTFPPIIEIRKNVSINEIVAEQQTSPISYKEIQEATKETKWDQSLAELLEALN